MSKVFREGQLVKWDTNTWKGDVITRAGTVEAVVLGEIHPNNIGLGRVVSDRLQARNEVSYLVKTPESPTLFWVSRCEPICADDELLVNQKPVTIKPVDRNDRLKLKKLMKRLGCEFSEGEDTLNALTWGNRLWFKVSEGIEHLYRIESIKLT